jgi:hypothetical protein
MHIPTAIKIGLLFLVSFANLPGIPLWAADLKDPSATQCNRGLGAEAVGRGVRLDDRYLVPMVALISSRAFRNITTSAHEFEPQARQPLAIRTHLVENTFEAVGKIEEADPVPVQLQGQANLHRYGIVQPSLSIPLPVYEAIDHKLGSAHMYKAQLPSMLSPEFHIVDAFRLSPDNLYLLRVDEREFCGVHLILYTESGEELLHIHENRPWYGEGVRGWKTWEESDPLH